MVDGLVALEVASFRSRFAANSSHARHSVGCMLDRLTESSIYVARAFLLSTYVELLSFLILFHGFVFIEIPRFTKSGM